MIYLEPMGGLANRMRVIAAGLELQEKTLQPLTCYWLGKRELNASFHDLFVEVSNMTLKNIPLRHRFLKSSFQNRWLKRSLSNIIRAFSGVKYVIRDKDVVNLVSKGQLNILDHLALGDSLYFKTCSNFYGNLRKIDQFKPIQALQDRIDAVTSLFAQNTIGLHIRRTDNVKSIQNSPTILFLEKIDLEISLNPAVKFFLATDDQEEEKRLIDTYGDRMITYPKELSRNSKQGIQDAVVDLYCLAKTEKIYGSYWSSFSTIAATVGNIPTENLTTKSA